ncbi:LeoA/HP0731 family dynamin-like GTPase [Campylobacter hominis]
MKIFQALKFKPWGVVNLAKIIERCIRFL